MTLPNPSFPGFRINQKFNPPVPLGPEWEESSKRYTDYILATSMINWTHPGFYRVLPEAIQLAIVRRLLGCLGTRNVCLDGGIRCSLLTAHCSLHAQCSMLYALCLMLNAKCSLLNAQCSMLIAQCSLLNASFIRSLITAH